jgi:hypothetical protein
MAESTDALIADIGRSAPQVFENPGQALKWVEQQIAGWQFLNNKGAKRSRGSFPDLFEYINSPLSGLRNAIVAWSKTPAPDVKQEVIVRTQRAFKELRIPLFTDPIHTLAAEQTAAGHPLVGAAAVAAHMDLVKLSAIPEIPFPILRGIALATILPSNLSEESAKATQDSLRTVADEFSSRLATASQDFEAARSSARKLIEDTSQRFKTVEKEIHETWSDKIKQSIEKIEATDAAFTKQMQLQAPVDYWSKQADEQKDSSNRYLFVLLVFMVAVFINAWVAGTHYVPLLLEKRISEVPSIYAVAAMITVLVSTIVFWIGRVMVRLFLSAHHLSIDAGERVVMIETFLALLKEGKLDEKEKALVLAPVFRSSADGIIKDEAAPDVSFAALVARFLDRK